MAWMELSSDPKHGGRGWGFSECLWSPSRKRGASGWQYWELLPRVREGDLVLHLRKVAKEFHLVGHSVADSDGYLTPERPPDPGEWDYARSFYRVPLRDFSALGTTISIPELFRVREQQLREYFLQNRGQPPGRRRLLFYVIQGGRLQCQNGAYLSEVDEELSGILFATGGKGWWMSTESVAGSVATREQIAQVAQRVGQRAFSDLVRANYGDRCCFPGCDVDDPAFLVGAHIARWADAPDLRGEIANGLCLCLLHDRAFERGLFTLDAEHRVCIRSSALGERPWCQVWLHQGGGLQIRHGRVIPSRDALQHHWTRTGFGPETLG